MSKRYWLKLNAHFFKDSHILFLKTHKNGYEYIYLWQCLLLKCLEVDSEDQCGFLRLNDKIPYSPQLLSEIFSLNIDVVKAGIDIFVNLGMMEILNDGTIYIESVQKLIGRESESAERVRLHRERKKELQLLQCNTGVTKSNPIKNKSKNKSKSKSVVIDDKFETLWNLYDKKTNKEQAIRSFKKIKSLPSYIETIIVEYVKSTPDKKYRKNFSTWLNNECWNDEIICQKKKKSTTTNSEFQTILDA